MVPSSLFFTGLRVSSPECGDPTILINVNVAVVPKYHFTAPPLEVDNHTYRVPIKPNVINKPASLFTILAISDSNWKAMESKPKIIVIHFGIGHGCPHDRIRLHDSVGIEIHSLGHHYCWFQLNPVHSGEQKGAFQILLKRLIRARITILGCWWNEQHQEGPYWQQIKNWG